MELMKRAARHSTSVELVNPATFKPTSYKEMDDWLNAFSVQAWTAILGAYTAGGHANVVLHMRSKYAENLVAWRDKDLRHFWNSRNWTDFKTKAERSLTS